MTARLRDAYDLASDSWRTRCPYGDICTECDAAGYCARGRELASLCTRCGLVPAADDSYGMCRLCYQQTRREQA